MSGAGGMISAGDPPRAQESIFTRALHEPFDEDYDGINLVCRWRRRPTNTLASGSPPGKALGNHLILDEKLGLVR